MNREGCDVGMPERVGPFRLVRRLGAGGMAETFEGQREGPAGFLQRVCIKRVLPAYSSDEDFVRLFGREARLAASLSHRNVTRVVDFGEDQCSPYLALELVEGTDLRRLLRTLGRPLPYRLAALIGIEVAEALEHAHTRGGRTGAVVHRDVSPANILVSIDGDVKLTDFGISKALAEASQTRSERVRGNLWYMAPEQLDGIRHTDPRSDLFSLGVVLYECLAGRRPYDGPTDLAAIRALSEGRRVPLQRAAPFIPPGLAAQVERLLAHEPGQRTPSAAALIEGLAPYTHFTADRRGLATLAREAQARGSRRRAAVQAAQTLDLTTPARPPRRSTGSAPTLPAPARAKSPSVAGPTSASNLGEHAPEPDTRPTPGAERRASRPAQTASAWTTSGRHPGRADASPRPSEHAPARWSRYALAPGVWTSASRAAEIRRAERRPLPHPLESRPGLPLSPLWPLVFGATLLTSAALGTWGVLAL